MTITQSFLQLLLLPICRHIRSSTPVKLPRLVAMFPFLKEDRHFVQRTESVCIWPDSFISTTEPGSFWTFTAQTDQSD